MYYVLMYYNTPQYSVTCYNMSYQGPHLVILQMLRYYYYYD